MKKYLSLVREQVNYNFLVKFMQISGEENEQPDFLAKVAFVEYMTIDSQVLSFVQYSLAIDKLDVHVIQTGVNWMTPILFYLKNGLLTEKVNASRRLKVQASFCTNENVPYKRGFTRLYMRCLVPDEAGYIMREVHEGVGGNH